MSVRVTAPGRVQGLIPALVVRPATRSERRRVDRSASDFLGAVEAYAYNRQEPLLFHRSGYGRFVT